MVTPGQKLNLDFKVKVVHGGVAKEMVFAELLTRRTIVSVYMKNKTGTCDRQNESLVAHAQAIADAGYNLVAVSRDTPGSHVRYSAAKDIPYFLVSDPQDVFAQASDSIIEKSMYGRKFLGPARAAYALERDGTVLAVIPKIEAEQHGTQLLEMIRRLR